MHLGAQTGRHRAPRDPSTHLPIPPASPDVRDHGDRRRRHDRHRGQCPDHRRLPDRRCRRCRHRRHGQHRRRRRGRGPRLTEHASGPPSRTSRRSSSDAPRRSRTPRRPRVSSSRSAAGPTSSPASTPSGAARATGTTAPTNPSSGAYGIPQALPAAKMASAGSDWRTNPVTQIRWGLDYIESAYGSPCAAESFKQGHGWY